MSLQDSQVHFFDRLSPELDFSPAIPNAQEIISSVSFSLSLSYLSKCFFRRTFEGPFLPQKELSCLLPSNFDADVFDSHEYFKRQRLWSFQRLY